MIELGDHLREKDALEITALGASKRKALWQSYRGSIYAKTAFVDGQVAAMVGLGGDVLSNEGLPWLMTTPAIERIPVSFYKMARQEVETMLAMKPLLFNWVMASHHRSCRLLGVLGFCLDEPEPAGPQGVPFRKFWLRREG